MAGIYSTDGGIMYKLCLITSLLAIPAIAQTGQQPAANPLPTWLHNAWKNNLNTILRSADKMPEEFYGLRPGAQLEVRTFGQQVGHLANYNFSGARRQRLKRTPTPAPISKN